MSEGEARGSSSTWSLIQRDREKDHTVTFAVHNAVVLAVLHSLASHVQKPLGTSSQHHGDLSLRLLQNDNKQMPFALIKNSNDNSTEYFI